MDWSIFRRRIKHRSTILLILFCVVFYLAGLCVIMGHPTAAALQMGSHLPGSIEIFSQKLWGWIFMVVSIFSAITCMFSHVSRIVCYAMLQFLSVFWGFTYLTAWVLTGNWTDSQQFVNHLMTTLILTVAAGWPEDKTFTGE